MRLCFCHQPVFGTDKNTGIGYCKGHQYKRTDLDRRSIAQKSMSKMQVGGVGEVGGGAELDRWFADRRKEMTGFCKHCGGKTTKNDDKFFKHSIAHILPKKLFKSVKTHPVNFIELCFWGNSCHTNFDNYILDLIDLNCYDEVIEKFVAIYPSIDLRERRFIPEILLQYVNVDI